MRNNLFNNTKQVVLCKAIFYLFFRELMSIKEKIGARITQTRKALGITIKELAERTGELSAARISNWEQGTRSPGPTEAKQLAKALNISASFLLCLTDNPNGDLAANSNTIRFIPII